MVIGMLFAGTALHAQVLPTDSTKIAITQPAAEKIHSPKKAAIYSAILPGLGQAYNRKFIKIPLVYIGFGAIGYFIDWNNDNYQLNRTAYIHLTDDNDETNSFIKIAEQYGYDLNNATSRSNFKDGLIKRQDYYRRNRDLLFITMFGFYGLNIIDASVDAHLFQFNVNDDLTLNWQPTMQTLNSQPIYSINFTFNF
jgi:hypothetical protein